MERKRYLELCQKHSVGEKGVVVVCNGVVYHPVEYRLGFDGKGKTIHKAVLKDTKANSVINCTLEKVMPYEK